TTDQPLNRADGNLLPVSDASGATRRERNASPIAREASLHSTLQGRPESTGTPKKLLDSSARVRTLTLSPHTRRRLDRKSYTSAWHRPSVSKTTAWHECCFSLQHGTSRRT